MRDSYELVKFVDNGFELEVNVSPKEDTVWLTAEEMSYLFDRDRSVISKHIRNIFDEDECLERTNVHFLHIANSDKPVKAYSLDVIISVGYRVKSQRGVIFRRWANSILKEYLLKGYAIDSNRVMVTQENYLNLVNVVNRIDNTQVKVVKRLEKLEEKHKLNDEILFDSGTFYDSISHLEDIISSAKTSIILIDGYVDKNTLDMLSKKQNGVTVEIYTYTNLNKITQSEIDAFNKQYGCLTIKASKNFHDRFLILDRKEFYYIGTSLNKNTGGKITSMFKGSDTGILKHLLGLL